jgi:hypothetical protein
MFQFLKRTKNEDLAPADTPIKDYSAGVGPYDGWTKQALYLTSLFEESSFTTVTQEEGLTAGILKWNMANGSLQEKLLKPFMNQHICPALDELQIPAICYMGNAQAKKYVEERAQLLEFRRKFRRILETKEMQEIQVDAADEIASIAFKFATTAFAGAPMALIFKVFLWHFDCLVQSGGIYKVSPPTPAQEGKLELYLKQSPLDDVTAADILTQPHTPERLHMIVWTLLISKKVPVAHRLNFLERKVAILVGRGTVGDTVEVRNVGDLFTDLPKTAI